MKEIFIQKKNTEISRLIDVVRQNPRIFVISGAGISTDSGIPDYRDRKGEWKRQSPIMHQDFIASEMVRKRYWARSMVGWRFFSRAEPNVSHHVLYRLERAGYVQQVVTQNVDGLHQSAGSRRVIDLHGRVDRISCLACGRDESRSEYQSHLERLNPGYAMVTTRNAPDGDADLEKDDFSDLVIPSCGDCGGIYMPKVVFYGGLVPKQRVKLAYAHLNQSDAVLVLGSSLKAFSAYQFCRYASQRQMPVMAINQGWTRHDGNYWVKLDSPCGEALANIAHALGS